MYLCLFYSLMTTFICRITMNLRTTAYTASYPQSSFGRPTQSRGTDGDIPMARLYPGMSDGSRSGDQTLGTQVSFLSKTDVEDGEVSNLKSFASGDGHVVYYASHQERESEDV